MGVRALPSDRCPTAAESASAEVDRVPTQRSGALSCCLVTAYEAGTLKDVRSPAPTTAMVSKATPACTAASHQRCRTLATPIVLYARSARPVLGPEARSPAPPRHRQSSAPGRRASSAVLRPSPLSAGRG